jgi:predicted metalloprotease with PDZ domain
MRRLNEDFAHRGRFFTEADLERLVAELAPPVDWVKAFFNDYVSGTRELDYDTYLGYAGLELRTGTEKQPALGFLAVRSSGGPIEVKSVEAGSSAEKAGLRRGDTLVSMNGESLAVPPQDVVGLKPGHGIRLEVRRGSEIVTLKFDLGTEVAARYVIREIPHPTDAQSRLRRGWLNGKTD